MFEVKDPNGKLIDRMEDDIFEKYFLGLIKNQTAIVQKQGSTFRIYDFDACHLKAIAEHKKSDSILSRKF